MNGRAGRKVFIGGNWKCNGSKEKVNEWVTMLNAIKIDTNVVDVIVSPPALYCEMVLSSLTPNVGVCAQNVSLTCCGAYTGEIAARQFADFGMTWALTGHSERRTLFHETDQEVADKTKCALANNLKVVACIGESLAEREAEDTMKVVSRQMQALVDTVPAELWCNIVIAYEPVWAIGTGKVATPAQAQEVHAFLRTWVCKAISEEVADSLRIIYGGSVKGSNCEELIQLPDVDGFLVGGAALKPEFSTIVACASL